MFWDNVKSLIRERNTTQEVVANECEISFATFRGWTSKGIIPKADQAASIAKYLGTSVEYLVTGIEPGQEKISEIRCRFQKWIDSMSDDDLSAIENLLTVLDKMGEGLIK